MSYPLPHSLVTVTSTPRVMGERGDESDIVYINYLYTYSYHRILFLVVLMSSPSLPRSPAYHKYLYY